MHLDSHDPTLEWRRCLVCNQALSAAFARVAELDLGPRNAGVLIDRIREEALAAVAQGAAS